jgi:hypothetical protein
MPEDLVLLCLEALGPSGGSERHAQNDNHNRAPRLGRHGAAQYTLSVAAAAPLGQTVRFFGFQLFIGAGRAEMQLACDLV